MKFRSKPKVIDAEQYLPSLGQTLPGKVTCRTMGGETEIPWVKTAHGGRTPVQEGDWIVAEPDGRGFYPIKPDLFPKSYEPLDEHGGVEKHGISPGS